MGSIKKPVKVEGLSAACDKLKMSSLTKNMLTAMAENGRHNLVDAVIGSKALDPAMTKEVESTIALFLKKGEKSKTSYKVDPSIIGGMVVSIGDKYADMSIASKMKKYTELIKAAA